MLTRDLMREVRRLQIRTRRSVDSLFTGEYHSAFKGQGIEFSEVREYAAGDDVRSIDWNVTARTGRTFIKRYVEERQLTVMLAIDLSASGAFGSAGKLKARLAVEAAAVLGLAAARNNDRVGLLIFTDRVELFIPPRKGRSHLLRLMREMLHFEPRGAGTDVAGALEHLSRVVRQRAVTFLISDFLCATRDDLHSLVAPLRRLAIKHELTALRITDPREYSLPNVGLIDLVDPESGRRIVMDTTASKSRARLRELMHEHDARLRDVANAARTDLVELSTDRGFVHDLVLYFRRKEKRR